MLSRRGIYQPQQAVQINRAVLPYGLRRELIYSPTQRFNSTLLTTTGTPTTITSNAGRATYFGSGNYFTSITGLLADSAGVGGDPSVKYSWSITFVITNTAVTNVIASFGTTPTDGAPTMLLRNLGGTIDLFEMGNLGPAIAGKRHTVTKTYSDISPYTTKAYLDGELKLTIDAYPALTSAQNLYIGSGYDTQLTDASILQVVVTQGVSVNISEAYVAAYSNNPWNIFNRKRALWSDAVVAGPAATYTPSRCLTGVGY